MNVGPTELLVVLGILLLLFGAKRLPQLARSLGQSMKELRRGFHDEEDVPDGTGSDSGLKAPRIHKPRP